MKTALLVLIHSPLVGPLTWGPVAEQLRLTGADAVMPVLTCPIKLDETYWRHHTRQVVESLAKVPTDRPIILVGHSGAGPLLPAIGNRLSHRIAGYVFVDCDLPRDGASRFDLFDVPAQATRLRSTAADGLIPPWNKVVLRVQIRDARRRQSFADQLRPVPVAVYDEALPVPASWPEAPCAYLSFTASYRNAAKLAGERSWTIHRLQGTHMQMLNQPKAVADMLRGLAEQFAPSEPDE